MEHEPVMFNFSFESVLITILVQQALSNLVVEIPAGIPLKVIMLPVKKLTLIVLFHAGSRERENIMHLISPYNESDRVYQ